jgi:hypothetical protein
MIAPAKPSSRERDARASNERFLEMLPVIQRYARIAFRDLNPEARAELVEESIANAFVAFRRLVEQGKGELAYATPLAMYAIKQVKAGRRVGSKLNIGDVSSRHCQLRKGVRVGRLDVRVGRLDHYDKDAEQWKEILIEDHRAGPAEIAAVRIDFGAWLTSLPGRLRKIVATLATGESTIAAAKRFGVSAARISQLRGELKASWDGFQGGPGEALAVA